MVAKTIAKLYKREAEIEIDKWFQNHIPVAHTTEKDAPCTQVTQKSRTLLHSSPSNMTNKTVYEVSTPTGTCEQALHGKTSPTSHSDIT